MIITVAFLVVFLFVFWYQYYLKEFIDVTRVYKLLRKMLESRDLMVLKLLPEIKDKKVAEEVLNLIQERRNDSNLSYDDGIRADIRLHDKLKVLYEQVSHMKRNDVQDEIFKRVLDLEKKLKELRKRYTKVVEKYNMSLTIHPRLLIKTLHMRPLDVYGKKES